MKYTVAWANALNQNSILKLTVTGLSLGVAIFAFTTLKLALRAPLVIERTCFSKVASVGDNRHSPGELEAFLREAIEKRFNSEAKEFRPFLSDEEVQYRVREQDELSKKGVTQRVLVNGIKIDGSSAILDADRIVSLGKVRSAVLFPLKVTFGSTSRTENNPYGLVLRKVSQVQEEASK